MKDDLKICNLEYLSNIARGDVEFIKEMIILFTQKTPEALLEMKSYRQNFDLGSLEMIAHRIKPTFEIFGVTGSLELLNKIESISSTEELDEQFNPLFEELSEVTFLAIEELSALSKSIE